MSRHILMALLLLASTTNAIAAQAAANAQHSTDAADATNASHASDSQRATNVSDVTNASDARSASGDRDSPSKSDAAAKRQAKATSKKGDEAAKAAEPKDEVKTLSGISILGNQEAPKSLVIVPWKSSEIGEMPGLSRLLDDAVQPIDKEVFMRELDYYEIRSSSR